MANEKKYTLSERIPVVGTGKDAKNFPKGEARDVHPRVAEKLLKRGVVEKKK